MTDDEIERLRDLASRAAKGPWTLGRRSKYKQRIDAVDGNWYEFCSVVVRSSGSDQDEPRGVANAEFIAAVNPKVVTELLNKLQTLQNQNNVFRAALYQLSCLGNGNMLGNSDGNEIAQRALVKGNSIQ